MGIEGEWAGAEFVAACDRIWAVPQRSRASYKFAFNIAFKDAGRVAIWARSCEQDCLCTGGLAQRPKRFGVAAETPVGKSEGRRFQMHVRGQRTQE
eukprot:3721263-Pleurochrysis_carterae.AAC.5